MRTRNTHKHTQMQTPILPDTSIYSKYYISLHLHQKYIHYIYIKNIYISLVMRKDTSEGKILTLLV